ASSAPRTRSGPCSPGSLRGAAGPGAPPYRSTLDRRSGRACQNTLRISCLWHLLHAAWAHDTRFDGVVIEGFLELLAGPVESRHDRPDRHSEGVRGVLVGETFDVDEEHDFAVQRGELVDRGHHLCGGFRHEYCQFRITCLAPI